MKRLLHLALVLAALAWCLPARADIIFFNKGAIQGTTTTTDAQAAPPAGTQADDIAIVSCFVRNTGDTMDVSGYTQLAQTDTSTGSHSWWWLRATGTLGTATCNKNASADSSAVMFVFRGAATSGSPFVAVGTPEEDSPAATFSVTAISTTAANQMVILLSNYEDDDLASFAVTATDPAAFTEDYNEVTTSTSDSALSVAYNTRTAGGSSGTFTVDYSGNGTDQFGSLAVVLDVCTSCITYTYVQSTNSSASGVSDPTSYVSNVTAGNLLITMHSHDSATGTHITTVTDSQGNTYRSCADGTSTSTPDVQEGSASNRWIACMWAIAGSTGANTVTAVSTDCSTSCSTTGVSILEYSMGGTPTWNAYAQNANATSGTGSNNATCGNITPTSGYTVLLICGLIHGSSGTAGTSPIVMTMRETTTNRTEDAQWTASGSINPTASIGNSIKYAATMAAFCGGAGCSAGGGATPVPTLTLTGVGD